MIHALMFSIAVTTASPAPRPVTLANDPPVRLSLNSSGRYYPGDKARVHVQAAEDGYLVVLRTDVDGWVRVLYPVDPTAENFVHGGDNIEVRSHGDREAFVAGRATGSGMILAAWSHDPFHFDRFTRNDHWDYRLLDSMRTGDDPEAALVDIAQTMAGDVHFDYDTQPYSVSGGTYYGHTYYSGYYDPYWDYGWYPYLAPYGSWLGFSFGFGFGRCWYSCFYPTGFVGYGRPFVPYRPFYPVRGFGPYGRPRGGVVVGGGIGVGYRQRYDVAPTRAGGEVPSRAAEPPAPRTYAAPRAPEPRSAPTMVRGGGGGGGQRPSGGGRSSGGGGGGGRPSGGGGGGRRR